MNDPTNECIVRIRASRDDTKIVTSSSEIKSGNAVLTNGGYVVSELVFRSPLLGEPPAKDELAGCTGLDVPFRIPIKY